MDINKRSLSKLGSKNPMWGKKLTKIHRKKIGRGVRKHFVKNPEKRKYYSKMFSGKNNPHWVGDKISRTGVHDWIERKKGKALKYPCKFEDNTCKGIKNWSNKSQKYLRRIYDWQVLCRSHHIRYDMAMLPFWKKNISKTQFKKGQIPWNKKF